jgi:predicted RNase H-like HicB family nuclease
MAIPNVVTTTKDINYYLSLEYTLITSFDEGAWAALYLELPGAIGAGDTREEAIAELEAAKEVWLESCIMDGLVIPEPLGFEQLLTELRKIRPLGLGRNA